ncbi:MAG: FG-GAP-like repeat-containing protein, partial [bacterium]
MIVSKSWKPLFRRAGVFALSALVIISTGVLAQENDYRRALQVISDKYHQNFPYLQGEVVAVKGADIFLSVGQNDRAVKGTRLTVLRKGAPFKHPVTGAVLGTLEDEIGVAEIVEVREKFSIARMIKLAAGRNLTPKVKDQVRLSSAKIRIAILPFINKTKEFLSTEIVTRELSSALLSKGRFDVYDVDRLQVWLLESGIAVDELLKARNTTRLRTQIRRDLVMENTIREVKGKKVLTSRLISLATRKEVFSAVAIADELPFEQRAPKEQTLRRGGGGLVAKGAPNQTFITDKSGIPGQRANVSSFVFSDMEVRGVSIADVTGDGKNEMVVISSTDLVVYRIERGRMRELARFGEGAGNDFRWLDVGDMNGDGKPEIYIANYRGDALLSMVLELKGKKFVQLVKNQHIFYRLIRPRRLNPKVKLPDKDKYLLLGQYSGFAKPLEGPIYRFRWKGKRSLRRTAPYAMPENLEILGMTLWDMDGDGAPEVVEIGDDDFMRIYSRRGEVRHTSAARYGAPVNVFDTELVPAEFSLDRPQLRLRSRLLVVDTDGDGVDELLTIANEYSATRLVPGLGVSSGVLVSLVWDGSGLSEIWRS